MEFWKNNSRNLFEKAETAKGITGEILCLLEGRLDNIVFRFGYCSLLVQLLVSW